MITFRCHACARKIVVEDGVKNHTVECPKCKAKNVVPDPANPTEFARKKEHAELKKIYEIREKGGMTEAEFEEVQAKVYELAWGAPPESVPKDQLVAAKPQFGGAAAENAEETQKQEQEEADFQQWLQATTGGVEDEPAGAGHAQTFGGVDFQCEHCTSELTAPLNLIGQEFTCTECHKVTIVPLPKKDEPEEELELEPVEEEEELEAASTEMPEQTGSLPSLDSPVGGHYKVVNQEDLKIAGTLNASSIQQALNTYYQQGWKVVTASNVKFTGTTEAQLIFILEK